MYKSHKYLKFAHVQKVLKEMSKGTTIFEFFDREQMFTSL